MLDFFCHAWLEKNREAERFEVSHHVRHKHILLEFTCLRFGCTCTNCFQEKLLGIDAVNSAGASVGKACIHCVCMLGFPRLQGKYCDLIKWIVIRTPPWGSVLCLAEKKKGSVMFSLLCICIYLFFVFLFSLRLLIDCPRLAMT